MSKSSRIRSAAFGGAVLMAVAGSLGFAQANAPLLHATTEPRPSFEVATIKPGDDTNPGLGAHIDPAHFVVTHASVKELIEFAYHVKQNDRIVGGPSWLSAERFDVEAKASDAELEVIGRLPSSKRIEEVALLVQSLLADRFQLKASFKNGGASRICAGGCQGRSQAQGG